MGCTSACNRLHSTLRTMVHDEFMHRALQLALRGGRAVAPNPLVGAVLVHGDTVIGEGWHERYGGPHAEVNAIASVSDRSLLASATLYVTLEPCSHFGKTPPCADLVIASGIRHVVVGCRDPFPEVAGRGIAKLREAGIEVTEGVAQGACAFANRRFITRHTEGRPYIILKWAQSSDGFIAPEDRSRKQLSGSDSQRLSHTWRAEEMGILVGRTTAESDNPQLTTRLVAGESPMRFVLDPMLRLPESLSLFTGTVPTVVLNCEREGRSGNVQHVRLSSPRFSAAEVAQAAAQLGVTSLIVEGGAETLTLFVEAGIWDEARVFTCPIALGRGALAPSVSGLALPTQASGADSLQVTLHPALLSRLGADENAALRGVRALQEANAELAATT